VGVELKLAQGMSRFLQLAELLKGRRGSGPIDGRAKRGLLTRHGCAKHCCGCSAELVAGRCPISSQNR